MSFEQRELEWIAEYIRGCLSAFGWFQWTITVDREPCGEESYAAVKCVPEQRAAILQIGSDFFDLEEDERRDTIAHELGHMLTKRIARAAEVGAKDFIPPVSWSAHTDHIADAEESAVSELAQTLALLMDPCTPPWMLECDE